MNIKTNDTVKVIAGKDRGKQGKVIQVFKKENKIVVEGVNLLKKHMRARKQGEKGQVIELPAPFNASNAKVICPKCGLAVRVSSKVEADVKKRVCKKCQQYID